MDKLRKIVIFLVVLVIYDLASIAKHKMFKAEPEIYKGALYGGNVLFLIIGLGYIFGE